MNDQPTPTAADKLKQALAAKKAKAGHGFNAQVGAKAEEKTVSARKCRMSKSTTRRM